MNSKRIAVVTFTFASLARTSDANAATKYWKESIPTGAFTKPKESSMSSVTINTKTKRSDLSMVLSRWCLGVATCLAVQCFATTGNAQTSWTNPGGGFWHTGSNWAGGSPPGPGGTAIFNLPNTYNALWNNSFGDSVNAGLVVGAGNVTFSNTSASTRTYSVSGSSVITGSGTTLTVGSFPGNIMQLTSGGYVVNSGGQIIATAGSTISTPGLLTVASAGSGTLTVQAGGIIQAELLKLGDGGSGTALVTGAGSQLNMVSTNGLTSYVGYSGTGLLNIQNGGLVTTSSTTTAIGFSAGSTGTVNVTGAGSRLVLDSTWQDDLAIGWSGTGLLNILDGGFVTNRQGFVGLASVGTGTINVSGAGSTWQIESLRMSNGSLTVQSGGQATMGSSSIGEGGAGISTVTVSGVGSLLNCEDAIVGNNAVGFLNVLAGGKVTSSVRGLVGYSEGSNGTVTVGGSGSTWNISQYLLLGYNDGDANTEGTLTVHSGGLVTSGSAFLGRAYAGTGSATGTATVTGIGSRWNISGELHVGEEGDAGDEGIGVLNVAAGGVVTNASGIVGNEANSPGTVNVTGSGSRWNNTSDLIVGYFGNGILDVTAGGVVANTVGTVGHETGSSGFVTVTGNGSRWDNSSNMHVGFRGTGTLNVQNGGVVTNAVGTVAQVAGSTGTATVTGSGSQWNHSNFLVVGNAGTGTLNVAAGGVVTDVQGYIGNEAGSSGVVTVTGSGSQWNSSALLSVGHTAGSGRLNVENGGVVASSEGFIGFGTGSTGIMTVTGGGSQWSNTSYLIAGYFGNGTLNVTAGGVVANTAGIVGQEIGSLGAVTVTGSGSRWNNSSSLEVGRFANGTLNIAAGGVVTNTVALVGNEAGSSGAVTVTGSGSRWDNASELNVGVHGTGTLNVESGGVVTTTHGLIGRFAGSSGTATVTGSGSQWINSPYLFVGHEGTGTLHVAAGGVVTAGNSAIGLISGSSGAVTVTGSGSQWNNTDSLIVGYVSNGSLNVTAGGVVTNTGWGYVGHEAGSSGTATVTGSGSQWNNGSLEVGRFGNGTLNIADGGSVTVVNLTAIDADGQINNSDGSFVSNTVINQAGGEILGRGSFSAIGGWSNSGFMAFRGGVSNVYGAVNNLAGGTIFSEFFGTTYFHGDVIHNGVQIAVGAGSRIEFQGTVSGAGNYFSGGTVTMNGAFRPGNSAGVVSFAGDLSFGAGASLEIEIGGLTAGSQHDKLSIAGDLALDGELEVSLINGFNPSAGQSFNILDWGSLAGTFSSISLPTLAGLAWNTSQLYTTGVLSVVAAGLPGDYNNNGVVDAGDYVIFRKYAGTSQVLPNDPTGGTVGTVQYTTWRNNYGKPPGSGSANGLGGGEVPEPNSLVLVCLAVAGSLAGRRSDRRRSC